MRLVLKYIFPIFLLLTFFSCMDYGPVDTENLDFSDSGRGLFIVNEGNFMYGNASLSYYDIETKIVENNVFSRANGINLGDVAQSMVIHNGKGYVVVNNSGIIFIIDINTFKVRGMIDGFISPRNIFISGSNKGYVTDLYSEAIVEVDLDSNTKLGTIITKGHPSTEQIVAVNSELFVCCWSNDNIIFVIDPSTNAIMDSIIVPFQPNSMVVDINNKIWVVSSGAYNSENFGSPSPTLSIIDPTNRLIEHSVGLEGGESPVSIATNGARDTVYILNNGVYGYSVRDDSFSPAQIVGKSDALYYDFTVDPVTSEIYIADAIDYVQAGAVYRYSPKGIPVDTFRVGIIPGGFCFKE